MLDEIINNPELDKYLSTFDIGQAIFLEGDDSQDLYILVYGELDVIKGKQKIAEISERGALFGEMSPFLGAKRTATLKAKTDVKTIRVPEEEITNFLQEFPTVAREIATILAKRLDETSQIVFGLKEFTDHLPDAVIMADREGKILNWNRSAEKLYGREASQMRHKPAEEIYEDPGVYRNFLEEVQEKYAVTEKVLKIRHPEKGTRYISTSTTVLYDGHHNFQGVLSLGRDVTDSQKLHRRYEQFRKWLVPGLIIMALLTAGTFYGYARFIKSYEAMDVKKQGLRDSLAKDYLVLKSLITEHFVARDASKTTYAMEEFFSIQDKEELPYTGLVLLGDDKKVFNAFSIKENVDVSKMIGSSYAGIGFKGSDESLHRVLSLYRMDKKHPMGYRSIEIAFEMRKDDEFLGWIAFQMDMDLLARKYKTNEDDFLKFMFKKQ